MTPRDQSLVDGWHILHNCEVPPPERIPMIDRSSSLYEFHSSRGGKERQASNCQSSVTPCPRDSDSERDLDLVRTEMMG